VVLTIGGSDSGGGAGIQGDLKTFATIGVFGTSALTCITAQTPAGVQGIEAVPTEMVSQQIQTVCNGFPIAAAKTGMLYSEEIVRTVANADISQGIPILVVDPVMVAASGARLLKGDAVKALCEELLPKARVVTPNLMEAEILCGHPISNAVELATAAREISELYDVACVAKGGHLATGDDVVDVLYDEGEETIFSSKRVFCKETHGCGCMFSSAMTSYLAKGHLMQEAVAIAKEMVEVALKNSIQVGRHHPLNFSALQPA